MPVEHRADQQERKQDHWKQEYMLTHIALPVRQLKPVAVVAPVVLVRLVVCAVHLEAARAAVERRRAAEYVLKVAKVAQPVGACTMPGFFRPAARSNFPDRLIQGWQT